MLSADILFLPASELAKRLQSKALSPVDLTKAYLDRSEKLGPRLNAYARLTPEIALAEAEAARTPVSLYMHIPFCESLCLFCACNVVIQKNKSVAPP